MGDAAGADAQALVQALNNASAAIQNAIAQAAAGPGAPAPDENRGGRRQRRGGEEGEREGEKKEIP